MSDPDQQTRYGEQTPSQARTTEMAAYPPAADPPADLVRQVTERVYDLWREEIRVERERRRTSSRRWNHRS